MPTSSSSLFFFFLRSTTTTILRPSLSAAVNLRRTNHRVSSHNLICIASLLNGVRILRLSAAPSTLKCSVRSFVTLSYPDKSDPAEEIVSRVISTIETTSSSKEICNEIDRLCKSECVSGVTKLLQDLNSKHISLGSHALDVLLSETSKRNDVELTVKIFKDLLHSSETLSSKSYCSFAETFAKTDDCDILLQFLRDVSDGMLHRKVMILNKIIYGFAETRQIEKALKVYEYMKQKDDLKCKPDLITYNTVIWILGRAGRLNEMVLEFSSMKEAGVVPDIVTYNTVLNKLQKFGRLDLCLGFMREVEERGLVLDLRTYTALIESFGRSGQTEAALKLFDAMKCRHVRPSIYVYRSLIDSMKKMGKFESAASLSNEMNDCLPNLIGPKDFKRKKR